MGYSKETANYHLPQYIADDRPSYLGDWNETMGIIDKGMQENKNTASNLGNSVTNLTTRVAGMESDVSKALEDSESALNGLSNVYTKAESDSRFVESFTGNELVVIGDSISYGTGTTTPSTDAWPVKFAEKRNLNLHNYAQNNAGFQAAGSGSPSRNFAQQVSAASSDTTFKNEDVALVIVAGGVNDIGYVSTVESAVVSTLQLAKVNFPNAKVVFIPLLAGKAPLPSLTGGDRSKLLKPLLTGGLSSGVEMVQGAWTWMIGENGYASDAIHPNTAGSAYYAELINGCIESGDYYAFHKGNAASSNSSVTDIDLFSCTSENGTVTVGGLFHITGNIPATTDFITLPSWCIAKDTIAIPFYYMGQAHMGYQFGGSNNVAVFTAITKQSDNTVYVSPTSWPMGLV